MFVRKNYARSAGGGASFLSAGRGGVSILLPVVYYYIKVHVEVKLKVHWEEGRHLHLCAQRADDLGLRIIQPKYIHNIEHLITVHFRHEQI